MAKQFLQLNDEDRNMYEQLSQKKVEERKKLQEEAQRIRPLSFTNAEIRRAYKFPMVRNTSFPFTTPYNYVCPLVFYFIFIN